LLDLARRERVAIVEDDYDNEFHYDGRPVLPVASNDPSGNVIYVGTFAKTLAPGLRVAFVVAPPPLVNCLGRERALVDRQGDAALECVVAELLDDGEVQRHVRRARRIYEARRNAFCAALDQELGGVLRYQRPQGGLALWAEVAPEVDLDLWHRRCADRGVHFQIGRHFTFDGSPAQNVRLGYASVGEKEGLTALRRMARALDGDTLSRCSRS
jgi:GntR family transcriptional regulator / MocR family aminotransferase